MACACKVNKELSYIQRKYGVDGPKQKKSEIHADVISYLKDIFVFLAVILASPLLILHVIFLSITGKGVININKLFGIKKIKIRNV